MVNQIEWDFRNEDCRRDLLEYCKIVNPLFETPPHIKLISEHLKKVEQGEIDRLIISMPPRHGKSFIVSEYFPCWYLGRNPNKYVIACSYGDELATDFGRKVRNRIEDDERFHEIFPDCKLAADSKSSSHFDTNKGGSYYAVGRGGALTGRGGDLIICDDLLKNSQEASSEATIKAIKEWYDTTLYTRLMPGGAIVIVLTRWTQRDIVGHVKELEKTDPTGKKWVEIKLPAVNEHGEALWPERYPKHVLDATKHQIGTRAWNALYMQDPTIEEGSIIKRSWIKYYSILPEHFDSWMISIDAAFKESANSDFVVIQAWAKKGSEYYLVDQIRGRMDFPTTIQSFRNMTQRHPKATAKLVEVKANGQAIVDSLKKEISGIIEINPKESKEARLSSVAPMFEAGNIYLPLLLIFSHEVKSLLGLLEQNQSALSIIEDKLKTQERELIKEIRDGLTDTKNRFDELLSMTALIGVDSRNATPANLALRERIERAVKAFRLILNRYDITLDYRDVPNNVVVKSILEAELYAILLNVLSNSIKSVIAAGGEKKVRITAEREQGKTVIKIMDTGIGINPSYYNEVFIPFIADPEGKLYKHLSKRLNPEDKYIVGTGSGLGLSIVKDIVQVRKGSISFHNPKGDWKAELEITLP